MPGQARGDAAVDLDDVFIAQMVRGLRDLGVLLRAEDDLGQAFAVAQIDEGDAAVIAPGMDPAGERDLLADVGGAESVAMMGAIHNSCGSVTFWARRGTSQVPSRPPVSSIRRRTIP